VARLFNVFGHLPAGRLLQGEARADQCSRPHWGCIWSCPAYPEFAGLRGIDGLHLLRRMPSAWIHGRRGPQTSPTVVLGGRVGPKMLLLSGDSSYLEWNASSTLGEVPAAGRRAQRTEISAAVTIYLPFRAGAKHRKAWPARHVKEMSPGWWSYWAGLRASWMPRQS